MMHDPPQDDQILFRAEVTPHRSLSARGMRLVIAFICCVSFAVTLMFWRLGAWPIAGFNGAEILLAMLLLRAHAASRRQKEDVLLSATGLRVVTTDARGLVTEQHLPNIWLVLELTERPGRVPALLVSARGRRIEIARQLGEAEKRDLAAALKAALDRLQNPIFDNPQLREAAT
jgi:uncharacterized membrane protein